MMNSTISHDHNEIVTFPIAEGRFWIDLSHCRTIGNRQPPIRALPQKSQLKKSTHRVELFAVTFRAKPPIGIPRTNPLPRGGTDSVHSRPPCSAINFIAGPLTKTVAWNCFPHEMGVRSRYSNRVCTSYFAPYPGEVVIHTGLQPGVRNGWLSLTVLTAITYLTQFQRNQTHA
jgi:hypothetical protein